MGADLLTYLGAAFLGGIILNIMPCVLPVLTMKVFHIVERGSEDPAGNRRHGLAYSAGVIFSFIIFAVGVIAVRASGDLVGWGMQFQNPAFVATLTALMVVLALNGLGVFEFAVSLNVSDDDGGYGASFANGIVASVMATPCSAPFLGTAAAFALGSGTPAWVTLAIFVFIGLGLAFPFALISFIPAVSKVLPRPGTWMVTFKKLMGFTLLGAAVWLYGVLMGQVTRDSAMWFLAFLLVLGVAVWMIDHFGGLQHSTARRMGVRALALAVVTVAAFQMVNFERPKAVVATAGSGASAPVIKDDKINWADFSPFRVALENKRKRPVFVDYTADWCLNCKTNEKLFIETPEVRAAFDSMDILPMMADWTNEDETITEWLEKLGRTGIPVYAIYYPDGEVDLLPEVITQQMVLDRLTEASKKYPASAYLSLEEACTAAN
ncbi:MAG: thioredoxin family protein [Myxococcota bacterium]|nr:thioredoxin family protein [Myxococcota bacterium]